MNFEQELQALVDRYEIGEIEITYKKSVTLKALPVKTPIINEQTTETVLAGEVPADEAILARYLGK